MWTMVFLLIINVVFGVLGQGTTIGSFNWFVAGFLASGLVNRIIDRGLR